MYPVKANFKNKYKNDIFCEFCKIEISDQQHQMQCTVIKRFIPELISTKVKYTDLFGNVERQLDFVKLFTKITQQREVLKECLAIQ